MFDIINWIHLNEIFVLMKRSEIFGFTYCLMLVIFSLMFVYQTESVLWRHMDVAECTDHSTTGEFCITDSNLSLDIEGNNFSQSISEFHRLFSCFTLKSLMIPADLNFEKPLYLFSSFILVSPVSIFIKGHALLN